MSFARFAFFAVQNGRVGGLCLEKPELEFGGFGHHHRVQPGLDLRELIVHLSE
jgi:hypothetical protein